MATVQRDKPKAAPKAQAAATTNSYVNLIRMATCFLVKVYVSPVQLRTLVGRKITGIQPHPNGGNRSVPTYDVENDGWLSKWFAFEVPFVDGVYDLSARAIDGDTDEVHIESSQFLVEHDANGVAQIRKLGYGEMVEHFGGARLKRGADGELSEVALEAESI